MAATKFSAMIEMVARRFGKYIKGTVSSDSSTTTLIDTDNLYEPDDYWVGHFLYMLTGNASTTERPITDYDQSDGKVTVSPAFGNSISSTETYEILPLRRAQVKEAIKQGIRAAGSAWPVTKRDTSTIASLSRDTHEYSLPTDVVALLHVAVRSTAVQPWTPIEANRWVVVETPGAQKLRFSDDVPLAHGANVSLDYLAYPTILSGDTDTLGIGEPAEREAIEFIVNYSLFWLHDAQASQAPAGAEFRPHLTQAQYYRELAQEVKARTSRWPPAPEEEGED